MRAVKIENYKPDLRVVGILLMTAFLIVGGVVAVLQITNDIGKIREDIFSNNETVSNDIMMQLTVLENFLDVKTKMIEYSTSGKVTETNAPNMFLKTFDNGWEGELRDAEGNIYYSYGYRSLDAKELNLNSELIAVSLIMNDMALVNRNEHDLCFVYESRTSGFDVVYPYGGYRNESDISAGSLSVLAEEFRNIDSKNTRNSTFRDGMLFLWEKVQYGHESNYTGMVVDNLEHMLTNSDANIAGGIYLYTDYILTPLLEDSKIDYSIVRNFYAVDYNLHERDIGNRLYLYRRLTDEIMYITFVDYAVIRQLAIMNNISFFIILVMSIVMLSFIYIYFLNSRRVLELKVESSEQQLKKSLYKSRLGHIMNTISEAFVRADSTYTILEVNQAAADMLGYRISEMLGQVVTDFMVKPLDVVVRKNEGLYNCYEVSLMKKNGETLYGLVNMSTVIKDNPISKEHYIMISDITGLIEAQRKAEEANRAKSSFIANLSHEIRTPMNATIGYIYLLEQTYLTHSQKKYLEKMDYASNTLLEIIDEILDFSKIEADHIAIENIPFNMHNVIRNAVSMFENTAYRKDIQLKVDIGDGVSENLVGDPFRLRQVIINVLSNAFKFTSTGSVAVRASVADMHHHLSDYDETTETVIKVEVADTGIGIPKERMEVLFQPFVQADDSTTRIYGGTGLGLAICKRLVHLMHGEIYAQSEEGHGSTFTFELPFGQIGSELPENKKSYEEIMASGSRNLKVLIVEDNPLNQELMVELLRQKGNKVIIADNGKVAEEILTREHEQLFDIILMDIQMPVQDGFTTARNIRESQVYQSVPVIAVTANADKDTQSNLAESGMNDFILKPINAADLYIKLEEWT